MKIEPKHALFNLINYIEHGITEIVLKNERRYYVLEDTNTVKKILYYYNLKGKDKSQAYFTRFWKWDNAKKKYTFDIIQGLFDLDDIDYVTTENLTKEDLEALIEYTARHCKIKKENLLSEDLMKNIMIDNNILTMGKISRFIYSYVN